MVQADSNITMSWNPDKKFSDRERWICVYPIYINSKKTVQEGRRIPKEKCCENPTPQEIKDVLTASGFNVAVENKIHPREQNREIQFRGRVRVQLKNDDGTPLNANFTTRESIFLLCGEMVPKLKSRQHKQTGSEQQQQSKKGKAGRKGKR